MRRRSYDVQVVSPLLMALLFVGTVRAELWRTADDDDGWETFKRRFGKKYTDRTEDKYR